MAIHKSITENLNEQQIMMMRLLKKPLSDNDFLQIRRLAVKLLAKQLDETIEEWEVRNNINESSYEQLANEHFRSKPKNS